MPKERIIIIGAGPAGLATGIRLAKAGYKPQLFEKLKTIITSPCAEGSSPVTLKKFYKNTGFDSTPHVSKFVDGIKIIFHSKKKCYVLGEGAVLDRTRWQQAMAKYFVKSGGELLLSNSVTSIDKKNKFIISNNKKYRYDILVNASGPLGVGIKKCDILVACQYRIKADTRKYKLMELYLDKKYTKHYSWIFPKKDHLNVGLSGDFKHLDIFLKDMKLKGKIIKKEAYTIPIGGTSYYEDSVFYIGDSAGMASPLTGGGIDISIDMSKHLEDAIRSGDHRSYEKKANMALHADVYNDDRKLIEKLSEKTLDAIGDIVDGKDLCKLGFFTMQRLLFSPRIDSRIKLRLLSHIK